jgi:hypothetical protein
MARKTVLCHFYNEEWILPFWLRHHREIFDHGIMIDYHSTDRSAQIIRDFCPTWEVVTSRNDNFSPQPVDDEVMEHEAKLEGWRICLNATEFLFGNYARMDDDPNPKQIFVGQWMFTDMERREEPFYLNVNLPLYQQRWWGYGIVNDFTRNQPYGSVPRAPRSLHNHALLYGVVGRHYPGHPQTHEDLTIFYYGYASLEQGSINRKMQIQTQCPNAGDNTNHKFTLDQLMDRFRKEQQPMSRDLREEIKLYIDSHESYMINKRSQPNSQTQEHIRNAIAALNTALGQQ